MLGLLKKLTRQYSEEENRAFKEKYDHFKELLERNNETLETLSLLSDIREKGQWVNLGQLRSLVTRTAVNVYRLIQNLNFISGQRYETLNKIFAGLEEKIRAIIESRRPSNGGVLAVALDQADASMVKELGAKAATLGDVTGIEGMRVPPGTALSIHAYQRFMEHNNLSDRINKQFLLLAPDKPGELDDLAERIEQIVMAAELPAELEALIQEVYRGLQKPGPDPVPLVMRSSAVGEDETGTSFAGLYRSIINPPPDELGEAYKQVVAGQFSSRVITYFMQKGFYHELCPMGVLMMELIPARAGGVMFTRNVQGQDDTILISGVWGLGKLAVEGAFTPDTFRVSRTPLHRVVERRIGPKPSRLDTLPQGGTVRRQVAPELSEVPCLSDEEVGRLARLGMVLERHFGSPQDIEWSLAESGELYIVQCRPLQIKPAISSWTADYPWQEMEQQPEPLLQGLQVGSAGAACGPAVAMKRPGETGAIEAGAVVLVSNTSPDLVSILPKAAAVVAQRGNTSGHLAIIAREFDVPLVIGLPADMASRVTRQGSVTVDAFTGAIYSGRVEPLLNFAAALKADEESAPLPPLRRLLDEVLQYVTPLNLINPRDPSFNLQSISTIHDIIRFAHEKAINAMFEINDSRLTRRGKVVRLRSQVPLDIYLIDLGGGIAPEASGRSVSPEQITSIPMRALYEGMTTPGVRWAGHVPIDFRSFMSVFANTMFDGSKYERRLGDRSYAILSHRYANFSSRLGYHFSIVDAYLGGEENEHYISFRFKGGAARLEKRTRRVQFLSEILRRQDFWVDQKADLLNARIKRLPLPEMEERLRMLGRLMGCSRQLDVTMNSEAMVEHYVDLFMSGEYSMGFGPQDGAVNQP